MTAITKTLLIEDVEHEVEVSANVTPFDPGRFTGPPEDCYPPEGGEVEDIEGRIALDNGVLFVFTESDLRALAGAEWVDYAVEELREADDRAFVAAQEERATLAEDAHEARLDR